MRAKKKPLRSKSTFDSVQRPSSIPENAFSKQRKTTHVGSDQAGGEPPKGIVLIGLPACGKSTIGRRLAALLDWPLIDTDRLLLENLGAKSLAEVQRQLGVEAFLAEEGKAALSIHQRPAIIATGSSVPYSDRAMWHLSRLGHIVYLKVSTEDFLRRVPDPAARGVFVPEGWTYPEACQERQVLYQYYADFVFTPPSAQTPMLIARRLAEELIARGYLKNRPLPSGAEAMRRWQKKQGQMALVVAGTLKDQLQHLAKESRRPSRSLKGKAEKERTLTSQDSRRTGQATAKRKGYSQRRHGVKKRNTTSR